MARSKVVIVRPRDYPMRLTHHTANTRTIDVYDVDTGVRMNKRETIITAAPRRIIRDYVPNLSTVSAIEFHDNKVSLGIVEIPNNPAPYPITKHLSDLSHAGSRMFRGSLALDSWSMKAVKSETASRPKRAPIDKVPRKSVKWSSVVATVMVPARNLVKHGKPSQVALDVPRWDVRVSGRLWTL